MSDDADNYYTTFAPFVRRASRGFSKTTTKTTWNWNMDKDAEESTNTDTTPLVTLFEQLNLTTDEEKLKHIEQFVEANYADVLTSRGVEAFEELEALMQNGTSSAFALGFDYRDYSAEIEITLQHVEGKTTAKLLLLPGTPVRYSEHPVHTPHFSIECMRHFSPALGALTSAYGTIVLASIAETSRAIMVRDPKS